MPRAKPIITITILTRHSATIGITERGKVLKEVGRRTAQKLLFEHAVAGDFMYSDRKNGATNIWIYDKEEFAKGFKAWETERHEQS